MDRCNTVNEHLFNQYLVYLVMILPYYLVYKLSIYTQELVCSRTKNNTVTTSIRMLIFVTTHAIFGMGIKINTIVTGMACLTVRMATICKPPEPLSLVEIYLKTGRNLRSN